MVVSQAVRRALERMTGRSSGWAGTDRRRGHATRAHQVLVIEFGHIVVFRFKNRRADYMYVPNLV
jgi:hypothetical protein